VRYTFCTAAPGAVATHSLTGALASVIAAPVAFSRGTTPALALPLSAGSTAVLMAAIAATAQEENLAAPRGGALHEPQ
jgi:hypothetical protein